MISTTLKNDVHLFSQPHMINMHKQMLEFAKRSVDRLLIILEKIGNIIGMVFSSKVKYR